jgi:hypothetical protein
MENDVWLSLTRICALTGFAAFVLKAWEFYRDRRPSLRVWWAGSGSEGDIALIFNSSKVATSIYGYSVDALPNTRLNRLRPRLDEPETLVTRSFEPIQVEVPAHGQATLNFGMEAAINRAATRTDDLWLQLWTSSRRRPLTFLLLKRPRA